MCSIRWGARWSTAACAQSGGELGAAQPFAPSGVLESAEVVMSGGHEDDTEELQST